MRWVKVRGSKHGSSKRARQAHRALDLAVDRLYRPTPFGSDRERVEHLFGLYEKLVAPPAAAAAKPKAKRKGASAS